MNLVILGAMMASDIRVAGSSLQRQTPRPLFQSVFAGSPHDRGESHPYAAAIDGQRFLIPQFESVNAGFATGPASFLTAVSFAIPAVTADRRAGTTPASSATAPITVVLNWALALQH
jgi:hypothetical protein